MNKPTRDWRISCLGSEGYCVFQSGPISKELHSMSPVADCTAMPFETSKENAVFIVTAWNACRTINPDNPLAVVEGLPELVEALQSVMIKLFDLTNPGLARPRPDLEKMHDGLAAALAKIGAKL